MGASRQNSHIRLGKVKAEGEEGGNVVKRHHANIGVGELRGRRGLGPTTATLPTTGGSQWLSTRGGQVGAAMTTHTRCITTSRYLSPVNMAHTSPCVVVAVYIV